MLCPAFVLLRLPRIIHHTVAQTFLRKIRNTAALPLIARKVGLPHFSKDAVLYWGHYNTIHAIVQIQATPTRNGLQAAALLSTQAQLCQLDTPPRRWYNSPAPIARCKAAGSGAVAAAPRPSREVFQRATGMTQRRTRTSVKSKPRTPDETYGPALRKAQEAFPYLQPRAVAAHADVSYQTLGINDGQFQVPFFGKLYHILWPDGTIWRAADSKEADITTCILLLHYLLTADGTPLTGQWIAFRNLPGGLGYDAAFQGRASLRLAHAFGHNPTAFAAAAQSLGGERIAFGDAAFQFRPLPRVWLAVVLHLADEEFPANANVLFDATASHYLPTEDLAVLGGMLAGWLVKHAHGR